MFYSEHSIVTTVDSYRALFEINEKCLQDVLSFLQHTNVKSSYINKMNVNMNVRTYNVVEGSNFMEKKTLGRSRYC